jgi:hypothetical protein
MSNINTTLKDIALGRSLQQKDFLEVRETYPKGFIAYQTFHSGEILYDSLSSDVQCRFDVARTAYFTFDNKLGYFTKSDVDFIRNEKQTKEWAENYYSVKAQECKKEEAVEHSLRKWIGMALYPKTCLPASAENCALCHHYYISTPIYEDKCSKCPIKLSNNGNTCNEAFTAWSLTGDTKLMLDLLRKAKEYEESSKVEFKRDDKVLVKDSISEVWARRYFSHTEVMSGKLLYVTFMNGANSWSSDGTAKWDQCIPWEGNEHLKSRS